MSQNTEKPAIAQYKPYPVRFEAGERYLWCSCGLSQSQPFCDRSHEGTDFKPLPYQAVASKTILFCGCKHSVGPPLCDGSHNNLADEYAEDERPLAELLQTTEEVTFNARGRAKLDGGCYVQRPIGLQWTLIGGLEIATIISAADEAQFLSQFLYRLESHASDILRYSGGDVVLFCTSGEGEVIVSGKTFSLSPRTGIHVRANEGFQLACHPDNTLQCLVTVCPGKAELEVLASMPENFDGNFPDRQVQFEESQKVAMADRFYPAGSPSINY